jgi:hypothetical protein
MVHDRLRVESPRVGDGPFAFRDPDDERTGVATTPCCPVAHLPEALHDDAFALDPDR